MKKILTAAAVLALSTSAFAAEPKQFSADMKLTGSPSAAHMKEGKIFRGDHALRMEFTAEGGRHMAMIHDATAKSTKMLMLDQKMVMDLSGAGGPGRMSEMTETFDHLTDAGGDVCSQVKEGTCKKLGSEKVGGRSTDKFQITREREGKPTSVTVWVDQALQAVLKSQNQDGATMELTNIKEGAQSKDLFAVPADFQALQGMGGMGPGMGGRPGGPGMRPGGMPPGGGK